MILSIFLVLYLCDPKLVSGCKIPASLDSYQIAVYLCIGDADLVALNDFKESTTDIVVKAQLFMDKY